MKYELRQQAKRETYLEQIIRNAVAKYHLPDGIPYESLSAEMMIDISHQIKMKCKTNVVGALYGDTKGLFYSFDKRGEWLQINPQMYEFICKHKVTIEKLNYYEWAKFLESVNDDSVVNHLLSKIDESAKRNNLSYYRDILFQEFENRCFYCGKRVTKAHVDVDHFIPWSFIKDDNIWNFVLACPECNRRKSDKLADPKYLDNLIVRNTNLETESYKGMENYRRDRLLKIYSWARKNGYNEIWMPKKKEEKNGGLL
ncbi:HNH endonuclease [Lachnospiraceae bacterium A10]|nr:HNH endonuclease [Lachnospiraceae bacterium A10]